MFTLIRILPVLGGYEHWFRIEGSKTLSIEFVAEVRS